MFNDEFMPYAIIVSLFQLQHWALERFDAVTAAMQSFSLLQCWESVCTLQPGTISSNPEQFSAESSQKYSRAPGCHWPVRVCTGLASNSPEQRGLMLYFWTELLFLQTLSLLRSKIAQSPFVEPSFGKMFLDLHSRHEKGKEALVRAG